MLNKTALVSNSRLVDFAGSEITTLEIANTLASLGMSVTIASYEFSSAFIKEIHERGHTLLDLHKPEQVAALSVDLAWVHHAVAYYSIFVMGGARARTMVCSSLSFFEPIEVPPIELCKIHRFLVSSPEVHEHFVRRYPDYAARCRIFPDAVPSEFWSAYSISRTKQLRRVAVVSNHVVKEIEQLAQLLREGSVDVNTFGIEHTVERLTPELLDRYDAVVTIGKTVQYCFAMGIPVFCYGHSAGPGWIIEESFNSACTTNFSGRSHPANRTAALLYAEFKSGFDAAFAARSALREKALKLFDLKANVRNLLDGINSGDAPSARAKFSETQRAVVSRHLETLLKTHEIATNVFAFGQAAECTRERAKNCLEQIQDELDASHIERDQAHVAMTTLNLKYAGVKEKVKRLYWALKELKIMCERFFSQLGVMYRFMSRTLRSPICTIKAGVSKARAHVAWGRFLVHRGFYVARHQGMSELQRKAICYVRATMRTKLTASRSKSLSFPAVDAQPTAHGMPLVSFVIPIYDRTDVLREAINSALAQTWPAIEVLLITDGSPQPTLDVVSEFIDNPKVRIFHFPTSSGNAVRGRNKGILEARGEYIAFLDSDDIAVPDRIEKSLPLFQSGKADVVYGAWKAKLEGTREVKGIVDQQVVYSPDADLELLKEMCVPCQSTVTVRASVLRKAGFLKPCMEYREDHELWARIAYFGGVFKSLPTVLVQLRLHAGNNELNFKDKDEVYSNRLREQYTQRGPLPQKIAFVLPGVGISGGAAVVFRHTAMLMKAGHDVTIINVGMEGDGAWYKGNTAPIVHVSDRRSYLFERIDILIATGWQTAEWLKRIPAKRRLYFVQSDERRFYNNAALRAKVGDTYRIDCEYFTEAHWIQRMLANEFGHPSAYVPNGLDPEIFYPDVPLEPKRPGRLRVLLEGSIVIPFKGMADAYAAVESLDCDIWIVSSAGKPPAHWRYDRFFEAVPINEMRYIYSACDIFIKMSRVEGFFGPPMEAMACGCAVVVGKVTGGDEYIEHEQNALVAEQGDVEGARVHVRRLIEDASLRQTLIKNGKKTAAEWTWEKSGKAMLDVVEQPVDAACGAEAASAGQ